MTFYKENIFYFIFKLPGRQVVRVEVEEEDGGVLFHTFRWFDVVGRSSCKFSRYAYQY